MNPRVKDVKPDIDFKLVITFNNGEIKYFDVKPYLSIGNFKELSDVSLFNQSNHSWVVFYGQMDWICVLIHYI